MRNIKVLSTKKLSSEQQELLRGTNILVREYDSISIDVLSFKSIDIIENAIVTSQNTARILIKSEASVDKVFCVGERTASLLVENGYNVVEKAKNAAVLAEFVVKKYKNASFLFFCGNKRRDELPNILSENKVDFTEEILYNTSLNLQKFEEKFDGILFFSPSGVESYIQENSLENTVVFCIGSTTANEAMKYTSNIVVSSISSVENVIVQVKKYFS